jgi:methionyl-tRNA synthetase
MSQNAQDCLKSAESGRENRYLTTAIPYVNAAPHIGFALEMIQADCLARLYRLQGCNVRFQAGTDENSLKNVQAAERAGVPVEELVRDNANQFFLLKQALNLSFDDFIRTSSNPRHREGVEKLWAACAENGDIYKRYYSGLYCRDCEQFYKQSELPDGRCPEHGKEPDKVHEENYFFRLSRYEASLRRAIQSRQIDIVPEARRNEVLAWIDEGLEDFSISRSAKRARGWGIPVPGDPQQVIYVWFDALGNYVTALGYDSGNKNISKFWHNATTREHVIGKGITRFHAVYWPAMLMSAGLDLPTRICVHGYITVEGRKIGKSAGNAVDPFPLVQHLGEDALRYFLLRHIRSTEDGDFTSDRFLRVYESELAGQLGNLAHRSLSMIDRYCGGIIPVPGNLHSDSINLLNDAGSLRHRVEAAIEGFRFPEALSAIWEFVADANKFVSDTEPWSLARAATENVDALEKLENCLYALAHSLAVTGQVLAPLLPSTSAKLLKQLGLDGSPSLFSDPVEVRGVRIEPGSVLFPKTDNIEQ